MSDELHTELIRAGFYGDDAKLDTSICTIAACCGASLARLIEACGQKINSLHRALNGETWVVYGPAGTLPSVARTPDEAVARLWLALNRKVG